MSPIKAGFKLENSPLPSDLTPTTGTFENNMSFSQAAKSAEKKLDDMFEKKLVFNNSPDESEGKTRGHRSLGLKKNNFSSIDPHLTELERDEFLTFEEKYNIDHKTILGEGASC